MAEKSVIDRFVDNYKVWRFNTYQQYAEKAKELCEVLLRAEGVPAVVTYRAKEADRLRKKLEELNEEKNYLDEESITKDFPDLAGARIAVYFPDQKAVVEKILSQAFKVDKNLKKEKRLGQAAVQETREKKVYRKRFFDYEGDHYHVKILPQYKHPPLKYQHDLTIEIQVVTVISSAWSQVEHDIVYKKFTGLPSKDEYRILDQFNGLVNMGELLLEQFYETHQARVASENSKFIDEYDLGSFLRNWISFNFAGMVHDVSLGPVRGLFILLQELQLTNPRALEEELKNLGISNKAVLPHDPKNMSSSPSFALQVMRELNNKNKESAQVLKTKKQCKVSFAEKRGGKAIAVIASTIMWLDELFRGANWDRALFSNDSNISSEVKECLMWLLRLQDKEMSVTDIWLDMKSAEATHEAISRIEVLWNWLDHHQDKEIKFAFDLSCLGMLKDPTESPQLQRIGSYLAYIGRFDTY